MHQSRHPVLCRTLDHEIPGRLARSLYLGTDAGLVGMQGSVGKTGPITADFRVKSVAPRRVNA